MSFKNLKGLYLYEIFFLFIIFFFTYTMPITVHKFTTSFFGKVISLLSIIYAAYHNIAYGLVLPLLFIGISEIGNKEHFESKIIGNIKGKYKQGKRKVVSITDGFTNKIKNTATHYAHKFKL